MAIARFEGVCKVCGERFEVRKNCYNRRDADQFEAWAANHIDTCSKCQAAAEMAIKLEKLHKLLSDNGITLPTIEGVSDKQIAYATDVRATYLAENLDKIQQYLGIVAKLDGFREFCKERGLDADVELAKGYSLRGLSTVRTMMESTSAREILDTKRF